MKQRFAEQWAKYERAVLPREASAVQREETKRGFYAGARALFTLMEHVSLDKEPTADDIANLDALNEELNAFARRVASASN